MNAVQDNVVEASDIGKFHEYKEKIISIIGSDIEPVVDSIDDDGEVEPSYSSMIWSKDQLELQLRAFKDEEDEEKPIRYDLFVCDESCSNELYTLRCVTELMPLDIERATNIFKSYPNSGGDILP